MKCTPKRQRPGGGARSVSQIESGTSIADVSAAGKALAMSWYSSGARTFEQTQEAFRHHPSWRNA